RADPRRAAPSSKTGVGRAIRTRRRGPLAHLIVGPRSRRARGHGSASRIRLQPGSTPDLAAPSIQGVDSEARGDRPADMLQGSNARGRPLVTSDYPPDPARTLAATDSTSVNAAAST